MIELEGLTKKFGSLIAVDNLSLKVNQGEIYGFIGPNGAGKTTTIKLMVGLLQPTSGMTKIDGFDLASDPQKVKASIGYIPDNPIIYEMLTGREFLHFIGELFSLTKKVREERISRLLKIFPTLEDIIEGYFEDYSRGNKQKVAILAALLHEPKVLLIDEPILGLDPRATQIAQETFVEFAHKGGTIFVSTHTLAFAQKICDRIGVISKGKLIEEGSMEDLRRKAQDQQASLEELYLRLVQS